MIVLREGGVQVSCFSRSLVPLSDLKIRAVRPVDQVRWTDPIEMISPIDSVELRVLCSIGYMGPKCLSSPKQYSETRSNILFVENAVEDFLHPWKEGKKEGRTREE